MSTKYSQKQSYKSRTLKLQAGAALILLSLHINFQARSQVQWKLEEQKN
jgi:hypothetical protein